MQNYFSTIELLGLNDQNLPPFKAMRVQRLKSIERIQNMIDVAMRTAPSVPKELTSLDPSDPEWDDIMSYPVIDHRRYFYYGVTLFGNLMFYSYNYNKITGNIRLRYLRYWFPIINFAVFTKVYFEYKNSVTRVNLFAEYCKLRANELVKQNEFLYDHEDFKKFVFWNEDLKETLEKVHRQANNNTESDFKDSELVLQDFIRRYTTEEDFNNKDRQRLLN